MADESIDLRLLAEQGKRILDELAEARSKRAEIRAEQKSLAEVVGKVANAVTAIAARQGSPHRSPDAPFRVAG